MKNTIDISKRTNVTVGEWEAIINHARYAGNYPRSLVVANGKQIANCYIPKEESNISREQAEANAAFIVLACNNFDKLVEALNDCVLALGDINKHRGLEFENFHLYESANELLQSIEQQTM